MRPFLFALCVVVLAPVVSAQPSYNTQSPEDAVRDVVMELFDGMRAGDTTRVRDVFHEDARLHSSFIMEGVPVLSGGDSIAEFVAAVGRPHDDVWNEQVEEIEVRIDGGLATAWMDYAFYLGENLSHCGVNAIQLVETQAGWKLLNLVDTRRRDCE